MNEKDFKAALKTLKELTEIQCRNGNWNFDPYMHGMANGMIFALSIFENTEPQYLEAPAEWLCDRSVIAEATEAELEATEHDLVQAVHRISKEKALKHTESTKEKSNARR